jgi:hypothetical protein
MIPAFEPNGFLPPGLHSTDLAEIGGRLTWTTTRRGVFSNLSSWVAHMRAAGCEMVFVDGSFVSTKPDPGDFDACYDPRGVDPTRLAPCLLFQSQADIPAAKQLFGGDIRIDYALPPTSILRYVEYFQRDSRVPGLRKGLLKLDLIGGSP